LKEKIKNPIPLFLCEKAPSGHIVEIFKSKPSASLLVLDKKFLRYTQKFNIPPSIDDYLMMVKN